MNRRDTIIVAVLINAGLLVVLFASALKSNSPTQEVVLNSQSSAKGTFDLSTKKESSSVIGDEVDQVLSQYANPSPVIAATVTSLPELDSSVVSTPVTANSFAEDLKPFSIPEAATAQPVAATPSAEKPSVKYIDHKVKKGDVLDKIARHHHCSVDELMKLNQLNSSNLRIGQVLKIPSQSVALAAKKTPAAPVKEEGSKFYIVKNGDNPWTIAVKNHIKVEDLLKLNDLNEEKARRLKPGDQIRIR